MQRRSYLQSVAAIGIGTGVAGCINTPESDSSESSYQGYQEKLANSRTAGDRVTADSLAVTIGDIATGGEYQLKEAADDDDDDEGREVPTAGGQWFLCQISVEQLDAIRREYPNPEDAIELFYEQRDTATQFFPADSLIMGEETYVPFELILNQRQIPSNGAFPGVEVTGWLVFEIPEEYELSQTLLGVTWGRESERGTAYWTFDNSHLR